MGTNYYVIETTRCPHCNGVLEEKDGLHIGKSSAGWCFSMAVHPDLGLTSWNAWQSFLADKKIRDEYGRIISLDYLRVVVEERSWKRPLEETPHGYASWGEFHEKNQSEPGPNNLLRHRLGSHCLGHGEGTWDYIGGEFS